MFCTLFPADDISTLAINNKQSSISIQNSHFGDDSPSRYKTLNFSTIHLIDTNKTKQLQPTQKPNNHIRLAKAQTKVQLGNANWSGS